MKVADIMTREVVTLSPDSTVAEAARRFTESRISGAPVVDGEGHLVGMLTEGDLLPRPKRLGVSRLHLPALFGEHLGGQSLDALFDRSRDRPIEEVMETEVVSTHPDETVGEAASRMAGHGVKRLPVLDGERLVGILSRQDVLRVLADGPTTSSGSTSG